MKVVERRPLALVQVITAASAALVALAIIFSAGNAAGQDGRELDLKNSGRAWELNSDPRNHLWISDYQAGEIWHLNPATDVYTAYRGLVAASDGRLDANGDLWWANYDDYSFGRLDLDGDLRTIWPLTGTIPGNVSGLNFDAQGRVWIPDLTRSDLYRFDPQSNEFCHYRLPNNSAGYYIASHGGYLWLADWKLPYIYRIDPESGAYTQWLYYRASDPRGMAFDDDGNLWWSGFDTRPALFRLDPDSITVSYFTLPSGVGAPAMVDTQHNFIWYSDYDGRFGWLNPSKAVSNTVTASKGTGTLLLVQCYQDWQPSSSANTASSTSSAAWTAGAYSTTTGADGWQSYQLPEASQNRGPWGIRARDDGVWVVDQERQKLVHIPWQAPASVISCKVEDADGDETTTGDQAPVENWAIDLRIDGAAQGITQTTGLDGCASWDGLDPGPAYGVQESLPDGWIALAATGHDFSPATAGGVYAHTFVNARQVSVSACKVEDADGDGTTAGDQTPVENWAVDLRIDGAAQGITQTTGLDGCASWDGLDPGPAYGVQEGLPEGWITLAGTSHEFGPASSGGVYTYTFVNSQQVSVSACKVEDEDGVEATTGDQTPLQNWPIDLRIDGAGQGITQTTGPDGCTTWQSLAPGNSYGVQEDLPDGWNALTGTSHDFGPASSGGVYTFTFINTHQVSVSTCKVEDADGDETTTGDQTPLQNWPIDLRIDGAGQGITQTTGLDGCVSWDGLDPGLAYGVQESLPDGWIALTATGHDFGPATAGGVYTHTFVNAQQVSISACKVEDMDGDETTAGDQSPVENWAIDLRIDGVAQGITQTTGLDGCTAWSGLWPGHTYGVQEEMAEGWLNLTDQIHQFPPAQSGDDLTHTFVNSRSAAVTACKLEDADGDLNTGADQTAVPDWTIYLTVDGIRQEPGQTTGSDGCFTWNGLAPGSTYGLEEALGGGWLALTPVQIEFDPAVSGGDYQYAFINMRVSRHFVYLPVLVK